MFCDIHAKYYIYQKKFKNENNIEFLTYLSSQDNYWLKKKYVLLRIKNTSLPNLTLN